MKRPKRIEVGFLAALLLSVSAGAESDTLLEALKGSKSYSAKLWDQAVSRIVAKNDAGLLAVLLDSRLPGGNQAAERRFKLFEIYRKVPDFYVSAAKAHWKGNLDCVVESVVPESGVVSPWEVTAVTKKANVKAASGATAKLLRAFEERVTQYGNFLKAPEKERQFELNRAGCELGARSR